MNNRMEGELILTDKGLKKITNDDNREFVKRFFNLEKYEKINYKLMSNYIYYSKSEEKGRSNKIIVVSLNVRWSRTQPGEWELEHSRGRPRAPVNVHAQTKPFE
jgi:hypothetical protein